MIKVNLLLTRKEKKKVGIRKEFLVLIISFALLLLAFILIQWKINQDREGLLEKMSNTRKEISYYKNLITEVNKAKESQKAFQDKLNVINSLRKEKASPARVLDEISALKPDKIQLESLKKEGSKLGIEGIALDDETVANFMTNLRKSRTFKSVDLVVSEQIEQSKVKLKKFVLSCEILLM